MRFSLVLILTILCTNFYSVNAQFYQTTAAEITFFSSAPIEDIEAVSNEGIAVFNAANGDISFKVKMRSFNFEKALMQEHFNENYVESEKYPDASFKGTITSGPDLSISAPQKVIFNGVFTVHGVSKERTVPAVITVNNNGQNIELTSSFDVACKDHEIKIPKILWENIAEVIEVSVNTEFQIISK